MNEPSQTIENKCRNVKDSYFGNPFKVGSDEWSDRSLVNSLIHYIEIEIILNEDTIKDYTEEIETELSKCCHSGIWIERVQGHINKHKKEVAKLKNALSILKTEGITDKEKLDTRRDIHLRDL